jgi:peptide deformylase
LKLNTAFDNFEALRTPCKPFVFADHSDDEIIQITEDLVENMFKYNGLGISANQLGLPWSVFAIRGYTENFVCFNPRIVFSGDLITSLDESCLSFPHLIIKMKRPNEIRFRFQGPNGEMVSKTFQGLTARVVQHEINHLRGEMWFGGCSRINLDRALRQAKNKKHDYSQFGLMSYAKKSPN